MKKVLMMLICLMIIFLAEIAFAEDENCKVIAEFSETIMSLRQDNVDLIKIVDRCRKHFTKEKAEFLIDIAYIAYEMPRYYTEEMKHHAIMDFKNMMYLQCIKASINEGGTEVDSEKPKDTQ